MFTFSLHGATMSQKSFFTQIANLVSSTLTPETT
jgi:hypothetical protein